MPRPIIGITCGIKPFASEETDWVALASPYVQVISSFGGAPLVIPPLSNSQQLQAVHDHLDGLLFSGGGDIHPKVYNAPIEAELRQVDQERDQTELELMHRAVAQGKPFLAICRGIQLLNVALGGDLYQDLASQLPDALPHDKQQEPTDRLRHRVMLPSDSLLQRWIDVAEIETNSSHHQAIKQTASELRICGRTSDGVIEAVELIGHPFGLGVQWHPERLPARVETGIIFSAFMRAAAG